MIGVTSAEAFVLLNNEEMELGLETETRNKLVSDLVTSSFQHHQKEIFSAVITEYTDWSQVARHPITTRQSNDTEQGEQGSRGGRKESMKQFFQINWLGMTRDIQKIFQFYSEIGENSQTFPC